MVVWYLGPVARLEAAIGVDPNALLAAAQDLGVQEGAYLALHEVHAAEPQLAASHPALQFHP